MPCTLRVFQRLKIHGRIMCVHIHCFTGIVRVSVSFFAYIPHAANDSPIFAVKRRCEEGSIEDVN